MVVDASILAAASIVCWTACRTRKSASFFFLANHVALLFAGFMIAATSHSETASTIASFTVPGGLPFSLMVDFTLKNSLVLFLGLTACAYCHVAFLSETRQRSEALAARLVALQRDY